MTVTSTARRIDSASRVIHASADTIYAALIDPDALMAWLPPKGMSGRALQFEPWHGGRYRIELTYRGEGRGKTSERTDVTTGRLLTLEPGRRLVESVEFESEDPAFAGEMILTWALAPEDGGTRVTVTAENVPPGVSEADHAAGLNSSLDNLARFVDRGVP